MLPLILLGYIFRIINFLLSILMSHLSENFYSMIVFYNNFIYDGYFFYNTGFISNYKVFLFCFSIWAFPSLFMASSLSRLSFIFPITNFLTLEFPSFLAPIFTLNSTNKIVPFVLSPIKLLISTKSLHLDLFEVGACPCTIFIVSVA